MDAHRKSKLDSPYAHIHKILKTVRRNLPKRRDVLGGRQCIGKGCFFNISFLLSKVGVSAGLISSCAVLRINDNLWSNVDVENLDIDILVGGLLKMPMGGRQEVIETAHLWEEGQICIYTLDVRLFMATAQPFQTSNISCYRLSTVRWQWLPARIFT